MRPPTSRRPSDRLALVLCLAAGALVAACGGEYPQSTLHPVADFGEKIDVLFRTIFWWAVVVFVLVEGVLLYVVFKYRERPDSPPPKHLHGSTLLELAWTLAPAVVLIFIAVPTIQTIFETEATPPEDAITIQVVGHQWWWEFRYPELDIVTANEMHVPRGRAVVLEMTSADVIHSFWAPKLGGKRDVMPGRTTRLAFTPDSTGVFSGQCAEFCGDSHANMRLRVIVDDSAGFAEWAAAQQAGPVAVESLPGPAARGAQIFAQVRQPANHSCILCHTVRGVSGGTIGPDLTHFASRSTIGSGMWPNTDEALSNWLRDPPARKPGSLMPKIALTDEEVDALVAYLRSLR